MQLTEVTQAHAHKQTQTKTLSKSETNFRPGVGKKDQRLGLEKRQSLQFEFCS